MLLTCSPSTRLVRRLSALARLVVLSGVALLATPFAAPALAQAPDAPRYRAFWVDTFNTRLNSAADVTTVVTRARQAHANSLFVQVRRRGDAWYLNSLEGLPDGVAIDRDFDPLAEVIAQAHAVNIEVHAFVVVGAVWSSLTPPTNPQHVFNRHGVNPATGRPFEGRENWLTRTLLPDGTSTSVGGHRFGSDFWIDLGHPEAAAYSLDVLLHLVDNYDIDGLHLDRIRYPEISTSGQTPGTGAAVGYNAVSLERYARRYGVEGTVPAAGDPQWNAWRRAQVTAFVTRLYLEIAAIKPRVKLSAALIANGNAPTSDAAWDDSEASWRVFQDWKHWLRSGILDLAVPMVYRTHHTTSGRESFEQWSDFTASVRASRHTMIGLGAYLNSLEGTLAQTRRALASGTNDGVALFSMGANNAPVLGNPYSVPEGRDTPLRAFDDLVTGFTLGRAGNGQWLENPATFTVGAFALDVPVPAMPWKDASDRGHLRGLIRTTGGVPVDSASITIAMVSGSSIDTTSDGNGFYGAVDLAAGTYRVTVTPVGSGALRSQCTVDVRAGEVATLDLDVPDGGVVATCATAPSGTQRRR